MRDFMHKKIKPQEKQRQVYCSPGMSYPPFKKKPFELTDAGHCVKKAYVIGGVKGAYKKRMSLMRTINASSFDDD